LLGTEDQNGGLWSLLPQFQQHRRNKITARSNVAACPVLGLRSFETAAITFAGIERAHRIRKDGFPLVEPTNVGVAAKARFSGAYQSGGG
jgi:hypothetical protein